MQKKWLFLGEASFRYSLALARSGRAEGASLVATSFGDLGGPEKDANAAELRDRFDARVVDGVDSTAIDAAKVGGGPFEKVFFLFPHAPVKGRVDLCRDLLVRTCRSVRGLLDAERGVFLVALARGQGGTPQEPGPRRTNAWELASCAAEAGLFVSRAIPFEKHEFGAELAKWGYAATGRRGNDSSFRVEGATMHELTTAERATLQLEYFPRDVSWFVRDYESVEAMVAACKEIEGVTECAVLDKFEYPGGGKKSLTVRMRLRGFLSSEDAIRLQQHVAQTVGEKFGAVVR